MKRSEYETRATEFRAMLMSEGEKPQTEQTWPEVDEWLQVQGTSTCTTPPCVVVGWHFPVTLYENADGVFRGSCGKCGNATVVTPAFKED
jgi:hypothetical protein